MEILSTVGIAFNMYLFQDLLLMNRVPLLSLNNYLEILVVTKLS